MSLPATSCPARTRPSGLSRPALALGLALSAGPALSQPTTWADVLTPDRLAESVLRSLVMAARTEVDIVYGGLSVDVLGTRATVTDLQVWPFFEWDESYDCVVGVGRAVLQGSPLSEPDRVRMRLAAHGVTVPAECLPPEGRAALAQVGLGAVELSTVTVALDYDVPSSGAELMLRATAPGFASADLSARFEYLWIEAVESEDGEPTEEPLPVAVLEHAEIGVENLGGWDAVAPLLPPQLTDPASAPLLVEGAVGSALFGLAGEGAGRTRLTDIEARLVDSAVEAWSAFLAAPGRLSLRTAIPDGESVYLDPAWSDAPLDALALLEPVVAAGATEGVRDVPRALLRAALAGGGDLDHGARLMVGRALLTGEGAPRDVSAGARLLEGAARGGDAEAAGLLAEALEAQAPGEAYGWALRAAAGSAPGAAARLDRLERALGMEAVLAAQLAASGAVDGAGLAGLGRAELADRAQARMTGRGALRSYAHAAVLARLLAAQGDAEGRALLAEIDARMATAQASAAWTGAEADAARVAMEVWLAAED